MPAIRLPETSHRGFRYARFARRDLAAAHLDECLPFAGAAHAALHETRRGAVLERDEAGRADQVGLPQAALGHGFVIARIAEAIPDALGLADALRQNLTHGEAVHYLLQDKARKHRQYLERHTISDFIDGVEQLGRLEMVAALCRAHPGFLVFLLAGVGAHHREARVVAAVAADDHAALLRE